MARIRVAVPFAKVSGRIGGPGGPAPFSVRGSTGPPRTVDRPARQGAQSPPQAYVSSVIASVLAQWPTLSNSQRAAWSTFASSITLQNSLRQRYHPSPREAYRYLNQPAQIGSLPPMVAPPSNYSAPVDAHLDITSVSNTFGTLDITYTPYLLSGFLGFRIAGPLPEGNRQVRITDHRIAYPAYLLASTAPGVPIGRAIPATWYSFPAGSRVSIEPVFLSPSYYLAIGPPEQWIVAP